MPTRDIAASTAIVNSGGLTSDSDSRAGTVTATTGIVRTTATAASTVRAGTATVAGARAPAARRHGPTDAHADAVGIRPTIRRSRPASRTVTKPDSTTDAIGAASIRLARESIV